MQGVRGPWLSAQQRLVNHENCLDGWQFRAGDAVNFSIGQGETLGDADPDGPHLRGDRQRRHALQADTIGKAVVSPDWQGRPGDRAGGRRARSRSPRLTMSYLQNALQGVATNGTAAGVFSGWPMDKLPIGAKTGTGSVQNKRVHVVVRDLRRPQGRGAVRDRDDGQPGRHRLRHLGPQRPQDLQRAVRRRRQGPESTRARRSCRRRPAICRRSRRTARSLPVASVHLRRTPPIPAEDSGDRPAVALGVPGARCPRTGCPTGRGAVRVNLGVKVRQSKPKAFGLGGPPSRLQKLSPRLRRGAAGRSRPARSERDAPVRRLDWVVFATSLRCCPSSAACWCGRPPGRGCNLTGGDCRRLSSRTCSAWPSAWCRFVIRLGGGAPPDARRSAVHRHSSAHARPVRRTRPARRHHQRPSARGSCCPPGSRCNPPSWPQVGVILGMGMILAERVDTGDVERTRQPRAVLLSLVMPACMPIGDSSCLHARRGLGDGDRRDHHLGVLLCVAQPAGSMGLMVLGGIGATAGLEARDAPGRPGPDRPVRRVRQPRTSTTAASAGVAQAKLALGSGGPALARGCSRGRRRRGQFERPSRLDIDRHRLGGAAEDAGLVGCAW
ncbi:hypothetical protein ACU686_23910 [Yinghuangia aomiensis]